MIFRGCAVLLLVCALAGTARAQAEPEERPDREDWALLLTGYLVLSAATIGGAHLLRDNFAGRTVAVSAGSWGGLGAGAAAGWGLAALACNPRRSGDRCEEARGKGVLLGALLGAAAGTIAAYLVTGEPGMSRTYTAAAGMAPAALYFAAGTIFVW